MKNRLFLILALLTYALAFVTACNGGNEAKENPYLADMDGRTTIRFRQYMIKGKGLYRQHCANCHGLEGEGLEKLIPPLAGADYLMEDLARAACQIRYGAKGEIIVNGIVYNNQEMPANKELRALEIAEIITYITNSWGNFKGLTSSKTVELSLNQCF